MTTYRQPFRREYPITQKYGEIIPGVTYKNLPHSGIDYGCPEGTEILASADGIVMYAGTDQNPNGGFGKYVIILHELHKATLYAHLSKYLVLNNQKVRQGDVIGLSGNTGNSTGPHLHFEARSVWGDWKSHFDPALLPLMSVDDTIGAVYTEPQDLKEADCFKAGDLLKVVCTDGASAYYDKNFSEKTGYRQGSLFYYTGNIAVNPANGLTYMQVVPAMFSVWIAVHDGETQILDD